MNNHNHADNQDDLYKVLKVNQSYISESEELKIDYDDTAKVIVVGEHKSGKTSLIHKALHPENKTDEFEPTIGFEFFNLIVKVHKKKIKMKIWDTCGQEVYRAIVSSFYRGTDLALLVFSLTNKESFQNLGEWLNNLKEKMNPGAPIIIVGTKLDLTEEKEVDDSEINNFLKEHNLSHIFFTSTLNNSCSLLFKEAAKLLYDMLEKKEEDNEGEISFLPRYSEYIRDSVRITRESFRKKQKKKCC